MATTTTATRYYMFEVRDSDGNDCTVYDVIVAAESREAASDTLWAHAAKMYPHDESDGGFGTYHACDCVCEHRKRMVCDRCRETWECTHGGLTTNEDAEGAYGPQEYATHDAAFAARATYHALIDLT